MRQRAWKIEAGQPSKDKIFELLRRGSASVPAIEPDALTPIFRRSMLWQSERRVPSAWVEHVPFAFWLVDTLRPRVIVELGTYSGVSYSAMCQAVKSLGLASCCFAVDTWQGDEHAGFYTEDVYQDFSAFHDRHYSAFSRLVRSTFDEALDHFEDGSINLLHIDGLHTYEAVRHDYQSWLPKLSPNAVVLFHDTNVREGDFAVHRLWRQISSDRVHFEFIHGHGLGVLPIGAHYADPLNFLFDAEMNEALTADIRSTFSVLGGCARDTAELYRRDLQAHAVVPRPSALQLAAYLSSPTKRMLGGLRAARDYLRARRLLANEQNHRE